jgi:hypothetical protein
LHEEDQHEDAEQQIALFAMLSGVMGDPAVVLDRCRPVDV